MKVAVVVCAFPPYKGGMGNAAFEQARQLVKLGNETVVLTSRYKKEQKKLENIEGVQVQRLTPIFKYGNAAFLPQLFWRMKDFDAIFLHYPFFGTAETVWLWKLFNRRKRLVIQYHMDVLGGGILGMFFKIYAKILMPLIIKSADEVVVSSFDYARNSDIKSLIDERFVEIPFGVDIGRFQDTRHKKQDTNKIQTSNNQISNDVENSGKIILFVGALDRAHCFKGVDVLIEAASKVMIDGQWSMIIVGDGDMRGEYEKLVKDKGLNDKIKFAGRASDEELVEYYKKAAVLVLPSVSRNEAFGMVLIEAMAEGTPVIASDLAGVRSVVDDGVTGFLVKPGDADDLAEKLNKIMKLGNYEIMKLGEAGRRKVEEKYNWNRIGQELSRILHE